MTILEFIDKHIQFSGFLFITFLFALVTIVDILKGKNND